MKMQIFNTNSNMRKVVPKSLLKQNMNRYSNEQTNMLNSMTKEAVRERNQVIRDIKINRQNVNERVISYIQNQ